MLRQLVKDIITAIPSVKRVFDQRDQALAESMDLIARLDALKAQALHWQIQAEENSALLASAKKENDDLRVKISEITGKLIEADSNKTPEFSRPTYSHWGEEAVAIHYLDRIFNKGHIGTYLDLGSYHPCLYSNTMQLYRMGWRGVAVDPNPFMIDQFRSIRPEDKAFNVAIGPERGTLDYYKFHDWASSNTASKEFAESIAEACSLDVPESIAVDVITINDVILQGLNGHAPDFMNIDIEGMDISVLKSNDWNKYRPALMAVEDIHLNMNDPRSSEIHNFLLSQDYSLVSRCVLTSFYMDSRRSLNA
jgi:FkbM family methyltransferase